MKVKIVIYGPDQYLVIVPNTYCDSAKSINDIAKKMEAKPGSEFKIVTHDELNTSEMIDI